MSCAQHEPRLREHAHGAPLSPALAAHLVGCAACQHVLAAEQRLLSDIDRVLEGLSRVEPSPIFLARARAIALDGQRSRTSGRLLERWPFWALPALAAALLIAALAARTRLPVERAPAVVSAPGEPSASRTAPSNPSSSTTTTPFSRKPLPPPSSRETAAATRRSLARLPSSEPSVLVPPGQADALVRLAVLISEGSVPPPALLLDPPNPVQELRPPAELQIRPLVIEPIMGEGADNEGDTL